MATAVEQKALDLVKVFERAGRPVSRVCVDGRKIEIVLGQDKPTDEFARIDMRYDKA